MTEFRENKDVRRPFLTTPDPRVYFPGAVIEKARRAVARCLRRGEGVAVVVGSTGVGKTLLARTLASEFELEDETAFVSVSRKTNVKSFLQQFMFGLRQSFCGCDETELRLMTLDYLERAPHERCVLLVDDAHNLSLRVFDELRVLIDQTAAARKQLSVALFGANSLEDRLNLPALFPFQQRVVSRSYLDAFKTAEVGKYIDRELARCSVAAAFTKNAKDAVAKFSAGMPRVVTQLCDRALFLACEGDLDRLGELDDEVQRKRARTTSSLVTIDRSEIERAWNDLQNIPEEEDRLPDLPQDDSPVVEFGLLDDEEDDEHNGEEYNGELDAASASVSSASESDAENAQNDDSLQNGSFAEDESGREDARTIEPCEERDDSVEFSAQLIDEDDETEPEPQDRQFEAEDAVAENAESVETNANAQVSETSVDWEAERYGAADVKRGAHIDAVFADDADETQGAEAESKLRLDARSEAERSLESRRSEAKRAFWNNEPIAFTVSSGAYGRANESETLEQGEQEEELEEELGDSAAIGAEIDEALDARLREKFGFAPFEAENEAEIEANGGEEQVDAAQSEVGGSYDVYQDGMKFEVRERSALSSEQASDVANALRFAPKEEDGSDEALDDANGRFDAPIADSPYAFDSEMKLERGESPRYAENVKAPTRQPIVDGDDGSKEYREYNGFNAEDAAKLAADDSKLDPQYAIAPTNGELSFEDRAYSQLVASHLNVLVDERDERRSDFQEVEKEASANEGDSDDRYLTELDLLEQEIAAEVNLIRRIRNIHMQLRSAVADGIRREEDDR